MRSVWIHVAALAALQFLPYGAESLPGRTYLETSGVMLEDIINPYEALKTLYSSIKPAHKDANGEQKFAASYIDTGVVVTAIPRHLLNKEIQYLNTIKNNVMENISRLDDLKQKILHEVKKTAKFLKTCGYPWFGPKQWGLTDTITVDTQRSGTEVYDLARSLLTHSSGPKKVIAHKPLSTHAYKKNPTAYRPYVLNTFGEHLFKELRLFTMAYHRLINRAKKVGKEIVHCDAISDGAEATKETRAALGLYVLNLDGRISDIEPVISKLNALLKFVIEDLKAKTDLKGKLSAERPQLIGIRET